MLDRKNMGETCGTVADLFAKTKEGLTVRETARALDCPENTIDFHVRMLVAAGNIVRVGKAALEDLGRPGYVYAARQHVATSKAWIAKNEKARGGTAKPAKPAKAKAKPAKAKAKPAKAKAKPAPKRVRNPKVRKNPPAPAPEKAAEPSA